MKRIFLTYFLFAVASPAFAGEPEIGRNATYYCADEYVGGLAFNEVSKTWESAKFRPKDRFIFKLRYQGSASGKDILGADQLQYTYKITLTAVGTNNEAPCYARDFSETVLIPNLSFISCYSSLSEYRFNLKTNRFLSAYLLGYMDGENNNKNTPVVSGGTCSKID